MNVSENGLNIIRKYEGCRLTAYKAVSTEKYYTIGYGHYGADVKQGMTISQSQAEAYLKADCETAVKAVNAIGKDFSQNQFDALVSFTYNCGAGNLKTLCKNRTIKEIGEKIILYNKSGGAVLAGLTKRRKEEQELYQSCTVVTTEGAGCYPKYTGNTSSIVVALQSLNVDSSYQFRKTIAAANGITGYTGTAAQNIRMLGMLKEGRLLKP